MYILFFDLIVDHHFQFSYQSNALITVFVMPYEKVRVALGMICLLNASICLKLRLFGSSDGSTAKASNFSLFNLFGFD